MLRGLDVKRSWLIPLTLFVLAAGLRAGWVMHRYSGERGAVLEYPDEDAYWRAARSLASGDGLVDEFGFRATYMPAYPAFLALFTGLGNPLFGVRIVQAILGGLIAPLTWLLARQWCRGGDQLCHPQDIHMIAGLAGLAAACDPFLVFFSGLLLTEALFAVAVVGAWTLLLAAWQPDMTRGRAACRAIAAGLTLGVAVMLRPSALVLAWCAAVVIAIMAIRPEAVGDRSPAGPRRPGIRRSGVAWSTAGLSLVCVYLVLLPWAIRNQRVIGDFRWLTTRGGISLYDGLQPGGTGASDLAHTKADPAVAGLDEVAWDAHWRRSALAELRRDPARVLRLAVAKFLRTWSLTPNVAEHRRGAAALVSAGWMIGLLAAAAAGLWHCRRRPGPLLMLLLPVIVFTLLHMVFAGSVRYRVPTMPMVEVLAAAGLVGWIGCCRKKPSRAGRNATTMPGDSIA